MSTRKSHFVVFFLRIHRVRIPLVILPTRCVSEIIEGLHDILSLFPPAVRKYLSYIHMADSFWEGLRSYGPFDMVDVDVKDKTDRVRVRILLR